MNRRKFLKSLGMVAAAVAPFKLIASSRSETTLKKKSRVLTEKEQFEFLRHFDEELKKPHITPEKRKCHE